MAKAKDMRIASSDPAELVRLQEDYEFVGRRTEIQGDTLVVFALPKTWKRKQAKERRLAALRAERNGEEAEETSRREYRNY